MMMRGAKNCRRRCLTLCVSEWMSKIRPTKSLNHAFEQKYLGCSDLWMMMMMGVEGKRKKASLTHSLKWTQKEFFCLPQPTQPAWQLICVMWYTFWERERERERGREGGREGEGLLGPCLIIIGISFFPLEVKSSYCFLWYNFYIIIVIIIVI